MCSFDKPDHSNDYPSCNKLLNFLRLKCFDKRCALCRNLSEIVLLFPSVESSREDRPPYREAKFDHEWSKYDPVVLKSKETNTNTVVFWDFYTSFFLISKFTSPPEIVLMKWKVGKSSIFSELTEAKNWRRSNKTPSPRQSIERGHTKIPAQGII